MKISQHVKRDLMKRCSQREILCLNLKNNRQEIMQFIKVLYIIALKMIILFIYFLI